MRNIFVCFAALTLTFYTVNLQAQLTLGLDESLDKAVEWTNSLSRPIKELKVGDTVSVLMNAKIIKSAHVFSIKAPEKEANLPTSLDLHTVKGCKVYKEFVEMGALVKEYDDVFETDLRYFKDKVLFKQTFTVTEPKLLIEGSLKYQVCDERGKCVQQFNTFKFKK